MFFEALIKYRLCTFVCGGISSARIYVHVVKFIGGIMSCKKMNRGRGCPVGIFSYTGFLSLFLKKMGLLILDISLKSSMLKAKLFDPLYTMKNENKSFFQSI